MKIFKFTLCLTALTILVLAGCHHGKSGFYLGPGPTAAPQPTEPKKPEDLSKSEVKAQLELSWIKQFGAEGDDSSYGIAVSEEGGIYLAGKINHEGMLIALSSSGDEQRRVSTGSGIIKGVTKAPDKNTYIAGNIVTADKGLQGFLNKYESPDIMPAGEIKFGEDKSDQVEDLAAGKYGLIYVVGTTNGLITDRVTSRGGDDVFIIWFNARPEYKGAIQIGSLGDDEAAGIAIDNNGNIYVAGNTNGDIDDMGPGPFDKEDFFVAKFKPHGEEVWIKQIGTMENDVATAIAVDPNGNSYVAGRTSGALEDHIGGQDVFVMKFSPDGTETWVKQFGTLTDDGAMALAVDAQGNLYVAGYTNEKMVDEYKGGRDIFMYKFDSNGELVDQVQLGTVEHDLVHGIAVDGGGSVYLTGSTYGVLGDTHEGKSDIFIIKYSLQE